MKEIDYCFRIYGDNILECELFIGWLNNQNSNFEFVTETGPIDRPILIYRDIISKKSFGFHLTPYYGNMVHPIWPNLHLKEIFNEKPDVLLVKIDPNYVESTPILIIEFDDALQAGNQTWQRSRRATNAAKAHIPYFYVLPLIGWEKASDGLSLKNPRFQNAMVTTGQISLCFEEKTLSLQIYKNTPWSDLAKKTGHRLPVKYNEFDGITSAVKLTSYLIQTSVMHKPKSVKEDFKRIIAEMLDVANTYSNFSETVLPIHKNHPALDEKNRGKISSQLFKIIFEGAEISNNLNLNNINAHDFCNDGSLFFKDAQRKTTSDNFRINLIQKINWKSSSTEEEKKSWLEEWNVGITGSLSSEQNALENKKLIPISYKEKKSEAAIIWNRQVLRNLIEKTYPNLNASILDWIYSSNVSDEPIFFVPLYGYKPTGDSRPDRGLIPYLYSNFPRLLTKKNTMVVMYSKHVPDSWQKTLQNGSNQLWTAIREYCGLVIVDKTKGGQLL